MDRPSSPYRKASRDYLLRRRPLFGLLAGLLLLAAVVRAGGSADEGSAEASLAAILARDGLTLDREGVLWLHETGSALESRPALFLAAGEGELADLYYAEARVSPGGAVLGVRWLRNLTRTVSAAEQRPIRLGDHVLYASVVRGRYDAVTVLDLRGEPADVTAGWASRSKLQNRITNVQESGRSEGFGRVRYGLEEPVESIRVTTREGLFAVHTGGDELLLDPRRRRPVAGADLVEVRPLHKGEPGGVSWVVDTVRAVEFIGPEPIEWLEHRVFSVRDSAEQAFHAVFGDSDEEMSADAAEDLGVDAEETRRRLELAVTDPELGWPPPPIEPLIDPPLENEGVWVPIVDDPFVGSYPNAPPVFYQTFFRPDRDRVYTNIYVVLWDPRQVLMRVMSGAHEPESTTGTTARGMAPRAPEVMRQFVGGFNGGFQAVHGEFGLMAEGDVYLPPKPWAATIAVLEDGRPALGSWLPPPEGMQRYEEQWAIDQIPRNMLEYRQNLTSVVEDGTYNPWQRWYWGAAPATAREQTNIHRTALCLTRERFMAYFWGQSLGPEGLGQALVSVRCVRGVHLDMNHVHAGFELYNVRPTSEPFPALGRRIEDEYEFEGPVPHMEGLHMRARRAVRSMSQMSFPRYIDRDPRDFFYLLLKPTLPGGPIGETALSTAGLPHAGWPHAFARAELPGGWVVRIDASRAIPGPVRPDDARRPLAYLTGGRALTRDDARFALYAQRATEGWAGDRYGVGEPPEGARIVLAGELLAAGSSTGAAIGVDADGFLVYVEGGSLPARMRAARVEHAIALPDGVRLAFVIDPHTVGPDAYERAVDVGAALPFFANERPPAEVLFPNVEPAPYRVWGWMQDQRVRYFRGPGPARFGTPRGQ